MTRATCLGVEVDAAAAAAATSIANAKTMQVGPTLIIVRRRFEDGMGVRVRREAWECDSEAPQAGMIKVACSSWNPRCPTPPRIPRQERSARSTHAMVIDVRVLVPLGGCRCLGLSSGRYPSVDKTGSTAGWKRRNRAVALCDCTSQGAVGAQRITIKAEYPAELIIRLSLSLSLSLSLAYDSHGARRSSTSRSLGSRQVLCLQLS